METNIVESLIKVDYRIMNEGLNIPNEIEVKTDQKICDKNINKIEKTTDKIIFKKILGYVLLLLLVFIYVISYIWYQKVLSNVGGFLCNYMQSVFSVIILPVLWIKNKIILWWKTHKYKKKVTEDMKSTRSIENKEIDKKNSEQLDGRVQYYKDFYFICIFLMIAGTFIDGFFNCGLSITSATSASNLQNSATIFVMLAKIVIFKSKFTSYKILGLIIGLLGIILIILFEGTVKDDDKQPTFLGDLFAVISAIFLSFYMIIYKYYSKKHKDYFNAFHIYGTVSLYEVLFNPIFLYFLHISGLEIFVLPTWKDILNSFINFIAGGLLSEFLLIYCTILLSPHIVSFGLLLTSPLSMIHDFLNHNIIFKVNYIIGNCLILISCLPIFYEDYIKIKKKKNKITNCVE